ncbi:ThiF family adenylyltransferase [Mycobacterium sp. NPDC048908]|uniref:ThiF family adenylyltransferase n=1 Tax=Mycobacterium sp. NPDC048908 TaxID=3364292 RepID=UPI0037136B8B
MIEIDPSQVDPAIPLEWWPVSDERQEVTTRRDVARPVASFADKTVQIWGCGGLGSWIAEYVVRAGAAKIVLCDPGTVSGGLLVRQNFVEADVGNTKVQGLAQRLRAISDTVEVEMQGGAIPGEYLGGVDVIIDATVSVAVGRLLDDLADGFVDRPLLAQVATDSRTGTLGILTVSTPPLQIGPLAIDRSVGEKIAKDGSLEAFHRLWNSSAVHEDQIIPTRGCSTPTFHGSAADLAGVAASLTSILGSHLGAGGAVSGTHLISMPHGEAGPLRAFVPASTSVDPQLNSTVGAA